MTPRGGDILALLSPLSASHRCTDCSNISGGCTVPSWKVNSMEAGGVSSASCQHVPTCTGIERRITNPMGQSQLATSMTTLLGICWAELQAVPITHLCVCASALDVSSSGIASLSA